MTVFIDVVDNESVDDELFNERLPIRLWNSPYFESTRKNYDTFSFNMVYN